MGYTAGTVKVAEYDAQGGERDGGGGRGYKTPTTHSDSLDPLRDRSIVPDRSSLRSWSGVGIWREPRRGGGGDSDVIISGDCGERSAGGWRNWLRGGGFGGVMSGTTAVSIMGVESRRKFGS